MAKNSVVDGSHKQEEGRPSAPLFLLLQSNEGYGTKPLAEVGRSEPPKPVFTIAVIDENMRPVLGQQLVISPASFSM